MTNDHSLTANPAIVIIKTNPKEKKESDYRIRWIHEL